MSRWIAAIVLAACVSPPATPEACREDISPAYASRALLQLAHETSELAWRAQPEHYDEHQAPLGGFSLQIFLRDRTIAQCIGHQWPANVTRCFRDAPTFEDCVGHLPHDDCVALEHALDIYELSHPRFCGESP